MDCFRRIISNIYLMRYSQCYKCRENKAVYITEKQYYYDGDKTKKLNHLTCHTKCKNCIDTHNEKIISHVSCLEFLQTLMP